MAVNPVLLVAGFEGNARVVVADLVSSSEIREVSDDAAGV